MAVESSESPTYLYNDDNDSAEQDIRAAEQAHRINPSLAEYLLGQEPFEGGVNDYDIRRILSVIACTGFMDDPVVAANFRVLQSRLLNVDDIADEVAEDIKETYAIGFINRSNNARVSLLEDIRLGVTPGWFSQAECLGVGKGLFFRDDAVIQARALKFCGLCQVRVECAEYGRYEKSGIWGGEVKDKLKNKKVKEPAKL